MEFKVYQKELELQSRGWIPTFHDISKEVMQIVKESGVINGTVSVVSHHTTCSVMVQECSHDIDSFDLEYLQQCIDFLAYRLHLLGILHPTELVTECLPFLTQG